MEILKLFLEGLLSFFTPCVLPLVPLYIGYLTQDAKTTADDGTVTYHRGRTLYLTAAFVLGICTVFVLAGMGSSALHAFFVNYTLIFQLTGGILLVFFGLVSLHIIRLPYLDGTHIHTMKVNGGMSFLKAYLMGFFFSFAWSPCVGPLLAQAIVKAASASTAAVGWLYIGAYALGFISIFLLLGFFTTEVLNLLKKYNKVVKYTGIIAGLIVIGMGIWTLGQGVQTYNASIQSAAAPVAAQKTSGSQPSAKTETSASPSASSEAQASEETKTDEKDASASAESSTEADTGTQSTAESQASGDSQSAASSQAAAESPSTDASQATAESQQTAAAEEPADINTYDFSLQDAQGRTITLSSYRGKTIILNFFGTWCYYCNQELPDLQDVHASRSDVEVLLVAAPGINGEGNIDYVEDYMQSKGYTMKIVYDSSLKVTRMYKISGYPTSFIYKPDGNLLGFVPGYMEGSYLNELIQKSQE